MSFGQQRVAVRQGNVLNYLHGDHLGSTSLTTCGENCPGGATTGDVVSERRYHPFGLERYSDGTPQTDFGYTGQRDEAGFGLYDYRARYYDPLVGRFINADSITPDPMNSQDWNRYTYVRSNPLRYTDPSGHQCNYCPDPYKPLRDLWYSVFGPDRPGIEAEPVNLSLIAEGGVAGEGDATGGIQISASQSVAFHMGTGDLTLMKTISLEPTISSPEGLSANAGGRVGFAKTSTNDMLLGPALVGNYGFGADVGAQGILSYQHSSAMHDFWSDPEFWSAVLQDDLSLASDIFNTPVKDEVTGEPVTAHSLGFDIGLNTVPNLGEISVSFSPGTNYTFKTGEVNLYPWLKIREWFEENR